MASAPALIVTAKGAGKTARLERSAQQVLVVDLTEARRSSADLGEILARVPGVSVRRAGALGSDQRFSLAGLSDQQVRFFLDGIPLELAGYPFGIANVPVNALGRVEIYSGVVPIRFGADALGGAVQLVSATPQPGYHGSASYQGGSFDTHRATLSASNVDPKNGLYASAAAFGDLAKNDYPVTVDAPAADGTPGRARVHRFHDGYRASGANLTVGVTNRPWAQSLLVRSFITEYRRELQNDPLMNTPYGEATQREQSAGSAVTFRHTFAQRAKLDATAGYTFSRRRLVDQSRCFYDWFGRCRDESASGGELVLEGQAGPHDSLFLTHTGYARLNGSLSLPLGQTVSVAIAPTFAGRTGEERDLPRPDTPDLLASERKLLTLVNGLEYKLEALGKRLEGLAFAKQYLQVRRADEVLRGGGRVDRDGDLHRAGVGAGLRYAIIDALVTKLTYEYATRLPTVDEIYGNGAQIDASLQLKPEVSHNGNVGITSELGSTRSGRYRLDATGFIREADEFINLVVSSLISRYANVASARSLGIQGAGSLTSPGEYVTLDANVTYQSFRNTSRSGAFANYNGDRMTNRPYLFSTAAITLALRSVAADNDRVSLAWVTRYTHSFYRTWESLGRADSKDVIPTQVTHTLALTYLVATDDRTKLSFGAELQNLTNARVFDFFGVERPGRAAFFKVTAEL